MNGQLGSRRYFTYNTERVGTNYWLWKSDACINSDVELSVWCKFLLPADPNSPARN
jgi:hypothetical protein